MTLTLVALRGIVNVMTSTGFRFAAAATTDDVLDALISKITKLLRQARDSGATPAEREAFEAKALALMAKHRIDQAQLDVDAGDEIVTVDIGEWRSRYGAAATDIADAVATAYSCKVWWYSDRMLRRVQVTGYRSDTERVRRLVNTLVPQALAEAAGQSGRDARHTFSVRRSYVIGFADGVRDRFIEAARLANEADRDERGETAAASTALVFVERKERVAEAVSRLRLRTVRTAGAADSNARQAGYQSGRNSGQHRTVPASQRALR